MADNSWGEIFNLNEELKRIEDEVDKRLEETLAADPHVIEQETVHYGSPENFRMHQSLPVFETPTPAEAVEEAPAEEAAPDAEAPVDETTAAIEEETTDELVEETAEEAVAEEVSEETPDEAPAVEDKVIAFPTTEEPAAEEPAAQEPVAEETPATEVPAEEAHTEETQTEEPTPVAEEPVKEQETPSAAEPAKAAETTTAAEKPAQPDNRRKILIGLMVIIIVLAAVLGGLYWNSQQQPKEQYAAAQALLGAGDYDGAIEAFTQTHGYKDSAERILEAQYAKAAALVDDGSYAEAIDYIDGLTSPSDAMRNLRASAIYQTAVQDYADGALDAAISELEGIEDYETNGISAKGLLNQIRYQQVTDALAVYDFDTAEPILEALGDYEDAPILLQQVQNAIDIVYTDVARDDDGVEIAGETEYLWVHSVITPGQIAAGSSDEEVAAALRELAGATDDIYDGAVRVLMMHQATTDAEMLYIDANPIKTDKTDVITMDISQYAGIDETFGEDQTVYSPQTLQRSDTDYTFAFDGADAYAGEDREGDAVRMECKMADDGYWVKTRRVYDEMEKGKLVGVPQHQLRTWTKVTTESVADEVREALLNHVTEN